MLREEIKKENEQGQIVGRTNFSSIFFDCPLKSMDLEYLKEIFFSSPGLSHIYFQKKADMDLIEVVKYLIEISPVLEDTQVEKYILNPENLSKEKLLEFYLSTPLTWFISYENSNGVYQMTTMDSYRSMEETFHRILERTASFSSPLEKILLIYNYCKGLNFSKTASSKLPNILEAQEANHNGFILLFCEFLTRLEIPYFLGEAIIEEEKSLLPIIKIDDEEYKVRGIYLFDPSSDNISKEEIQNGNIRLLNYNYFAMRLTDFPNTIFSDRLYGVLSCLVHDLSYDLEKVNLQMPQESKKMEESFHDSFPHIHHLVAETKEISEETLCSLIHKVTPFFEFSVIDEEVILDNYRVRKQKIFKKHSYNDFS